MSSMDFGRYKRMVRYFWDPQPKNNDSMNVSLWCLGKRYDSMPGVNSNRNNYSPTINDKNGEIGSVCNKDDTFQAFKRPSFETSGDEDDRGWPKEFLDDFESKIWFTYRSNFPAIKKSGDSKPTAVSTLLRSQTVDQGGFTSDSGWGCMIRSGQSLLANTLLILRLGRGMENWCPLDGHYLTYQ